MAKQDAATFKELMIPIIKVISENGGKATNPEIFAGLVKLGFQEGSRHADGPRSELKYRSAWAQSYLKAFGAISNPQRGVWVTTEQALGLKEEDVPMIIRRAIQLSKEKKANDKPKKTLSPRQASSRSKSDADTEDVSAIDQARTIIKLMERGLISKEHANKALAQLS